MNIILIFIFIFKGQQHPQYIQTLRRLVREVAKLGISILIAVDEKDPFSIANKLIIMDRWGVARLAM